MDNWRDNLMKKVASKEHSNSLDTTDKVVKFFEQEFDNLLKVLPNQGEGIANVKEESNEVRFIIYKNYVKLVVEESKYEVDVYITQNEREKHYAKIRIESNETYAGTENRHGIPKEIKHYVDEEFVDEVFRRAFEYLK